MATTMVGPPALAGEISTPDALGYSPKFPAADLVPLMASVLRGAALDHSGGLGWVRTEAPEGPVWHARVAPGLISFGRVDPARAQRRAERLERARRAWLTLCDSWHVQMDARTASLALRAAGLIPQCEVVPDPGAYPLDRFESKAKIKEWSTKSRSNMVRRLSTLDYGPLVAAGTPAMITLTLPDGWEAIAPNGAAFKLLVRRFLKRYARAWGAQLVGVWKLEFQRRGAPHLHVLMVPPRGTVHGAQWRQWFAGTWASIVMDAHRNSSSAGASSSAELSELNRKIYAVHEHRSASADFAEGLRASDPRRVAVYFLKHNTAGDKEYQHVVPAAWRGEGEGPGRFWGYWGLDRAEGLVPLTVDQAIELARVLRRWDRSKGRVRVAKVWRVDHSTGQVRRRPVRRRVKSMRATAGFLVVNDGPAVALMLADALRT